MKTTLMAATAALMIAISPLAAEPVTFVPEQQTTEILGSDFIGTPVVAKDGQQIGKIANLVFDHTGHIELAVIGIGGFLGIGEKDVAVSFDALKGATFKDKPAFEIDATKEDVTAAPSYKTLDYRAVRERIAAWRAKASQSWQDIKAKAGTAYDDAKERARKAYEDAKEKVNEARSGETKSQ
jgi:sporulation protein YlmC with PRC-barrel domain